MNANARRLPVLARNSKAKDPSYNARNLFIQKRSLCGISPQDLNPVRLELNRNGQILSSLLEQIGLISAPSIKAILYSVQEGLSRALAMPEHIAGAILGSTGLEIDISCYWR